MATTDTKDMTTGNPVRLLLAFSMPLMLGNLFQQLYTFVDALIVGQCVSSNALAAVYCVIAIRKIEVCRIGYRFLCVLALGFPLLYCLYVLRACIQGMGDSVMPMLSSFIQVIMRVICALFLTRVIGNEGVFWGEVLVWVGADVFLGIVCMKKMILNSLSLLK